MFGVTTNVHVFLPIEGCGDMKMRTREHKNTRTQEHKYLRTKLGNRPKLFRGLCILDLGLVGDHLGLGLGFGLGLVHVMQTQPLNYATLLSHRATVRPANAPRAKQLSEDDVESEAQVLANFDFLQNDIEEDEDNEDDLDDGGSADDESDEREDEEDGRRKRAKPGEQGGMLHSRAHFQQSLMLL